MWFHTKHSGRVHRHLSNWYNYHVYNMEKGIHPKIWQLLAIDPDESNVHPPATIRISLIVYSVHM